MAHARSSRAPTVSIRDSRWIKTRRRCATSIVATSSGRRSRRWRTTSTAPSTTWSTSRCASTRARRITKFPALPIPARSFPRPVLAHRCGRRWGPHRGCDPWLLDRRRRRLPRRCPWRLRCRSRLRSRPRDRPCRPLQPRVATPRCRRALGGVHRCLRPPRTPIRARARWLRPPLYRRRPQAGRPRYRLQPRRDRWKRLRRHCI